MSDANISLVQDLYAAFARGEVGTIVSACAPDVDWRLVGRKDDYPTFGAWKGPSEVEKFFKLVADMEDFQDFSPREFHGSGDKVFVLGFYALTVKKTGRAMATEWCHVFTIRDGKVAAFREFTDTAQAAAAYRG
jgi:ketosteroid isomerase-like protein